MGSPITFSGFNNVDFKIVLDAILQQERQPELALQQRQLALQQRNTAYGTLSGRVTALRSATSSLAATSSLSGRSATNTDPTSVSVSVSSSTAVGAYDLVVNELARAQVTASDSPHTDKDSTIVASSGTLTIGGVPVTISGGVTLEELAQAINETANIGVTATIVKPTSSTYQLVLTGTDTGEAAAFSVVNGLGGGSGVTFAATNAQEATDAEVEVNGITVTSATNTIEDAIGGSTLTLLKKDDTRTITVSIGQDTSPAVQMIQRFVSAYNDLASFVKGQQTASVSSSQTSIANDSVVRELSSGLRSLIGGENTADGSLKYLSNVGVSFSRTGELTFDQGKFTEAIGDDLEHVQALFSGAGGVNGIFSDVDALLTEYTAADGFISSAQTRLTDQTKSITDQLNAFESRLAVRRESLQREFTAADKAMAALNAQVNSLSSIGSQYRLF